MTQIIIFLVVLAISIAVQLLFPPESPDNDLKASDIDAFTLPTAEEGRSIPDLIGMQLIRGINCIWYGGLNDEPINIPNGKSAEITVGFAYFLSMLWVLAREIDYIDEYYFNGNKVWSGTASGPYDTFNAKTGQRAEVQGSSNGASIIAFADGTQDEALPNMEASMDRDTSYRSCSLIWMHDVFVGDNTTTVGRMAFRGHNRSRLAPELNQDFADIDSDANPIHAIYYVMTKRLRLAGGSIGIANFDDVAEVCFNEGLGVSFMMNSAQPGKEWIREVLRHIDGVLYRDREDGLYKIKLMRADYDVEALPVVDESMFNSLVLIRRGWEDVYSDLEVQYTSRVKWAKRTATFVNAAARQNLGYVKKQTVNFGMFTNEPAVANAMTRLKVRLFYPNATVKFRISSDDFDYNPGDVIKLDYSRYGLSGLVLRIINIGGADSEEQSIDVECLEDIFGLGNAQISGIPEGEFVPTDYALPNAMTLAFLKDAVAELIDPNDDAENMVMVAGAPPTTGITDRYNLRLSGSDKGDRPYDGTGLLEDDFPGEPEDFINRDPDGFVVELGVNITPVTNTHSRWQRLNTVCLLDAGGDEFEIMSVQNIEDLGSGRYRFTNLLRGLAGTPIMEHAAGARVWISGVEGGLFQGVRTTSFAMSAAFRAVNRFNISEPLTLTHEYGFRPQKPYNIGSVIAGREGNTVTFFFDMRNRHGGLGHNNIDEWTVDYPLPEALLSIQVDGADPNIVQFGYEIVTSLFDPNLQYGIMPLGDYGEFPLGRCVIIYDCGAPDPIPFVLRPYLNGHYADETFSITI